MQSREFRQRWVFGRLGSLNSARNQQALAAKNLNAARKTPLVAAIPKMLFPGVVTLLGMVALAEGRSSLKTTAWPCPCCSGVTSTAGCSVSD
jgi:hypothetical protein